MNERIKIIRNKLNLTLEKFGQRIGVTRAAISNIETCLLYTSDAADE